MKRLLVKRGKTVFLIFVCISFITLAVSLIRQHYSAYPKIDISVEREVDLNKIGSQYERLLSSNEYTYNPLGYPIIPGDMSDYRIVAKYSSGPEWDLLTAIGIKENAPSSAKESLTKCSLNVRDEYRPGNVTLDPVSYRFTVTFYAENEWVKLRMSYSSNTYSTEEMERELLNIIRTTNESSESEL